MLLKKTCHRASAAARLGEDGSRLIKTAYRTHRIKQINRKLDNFDEPNLND